MRLQFSSALRNAKNNAMEGAVGASPKLQLWDGAIPTNVVTGPIGLLLCEIQLPVDWLGGSSSGSLQKAGVWEGVGAAAGTARYFRLIGGSGCHMQGDVGLTGADVALQMNSTAISAGAPVVVQVFTLVDGNP